MGNAVNCRGVTTDRISPPLKLAAVASPATGPLDIVGAAIWLFRTNFGTNVQQRDKNAEVSTPIFWEKPASCLKIVQLQRLGNLTELQRPFRPQQRRVPAQDAPSCVICQDADPASVAVFQIPRLP
jgi:hypothetical protein